VKAEIKYESEAAMCSAFTKWANAQGWVVYPETEGWDMLLVNRVDGTQIGVQAKLRFNPTLLRQVIPGSGIWGDVECGPDYRAILLPKYDRDVDDAMKTLGIVSFSAISDFFRPKIDSIDYFYFGQWPIDKRLPLPQYVPDVVAGASGPIQLTKWKIGALRITAILDVRGYVTREDFRKHGVDFRRWPASDWLKLDKDGRYIRGERLKVDTQHPIVFAEIKREVEQSMAESEAGK